MYHYKECGLDSVYLANGYSETDSPSGKGIQIHDIDGLHKAISKGLVEKESLLSPKEFKFLRVELDFSQRALGMLLDKQDQTIAGWEKGQQDIPLLADYAIRNIYMESIGENAIAGLLQKFSELDREYTEACLELEETQAGWGLHI